MQSKFLKTLGLCRRAGKLCYGYDMVVEALDKSAAVYFASDLSARTRNSVLQQAKRRKVPCTDIKVDMNELAYAIGTKPVGVVSVTDKGFAALLEKAQQD